MKIYKRLNLMNTKLKKSKNYYKRLFKYTYLNYLDVIFTFLTFFKVADLRVLATFFFPPIIEQ
jgi:hypothetical protein